MAVHAAIDSVALHYGPGIRPCRDRAWTRYVPPALVDEGSAAVVRGSSGVAAGPVSNGSVLGSCLFGQLATKW